MSCLTCDDRSCDSCKIRLLQEELEDVHQSYDDLVRASNAQLVAMSTAVSHAIAKCLSDIEAISEDLHPNEY